MREGDLRSGGSPSWCQTGNQDHGTESAPLRFTESCLVVSIGPTVLIPLVVSCCAVPGTARPALSWLAVSLRIAPAPVAVGMVSADRMCTVSIGAAQVLWFRPEPAQATPVSTAKDVSHAAV
jgi:hypothetical protein